MVTLVIPVFNKVELTKRCLASVLKNSRRLRKVVVIDNGSSDQTANTLREFQNEFAAKLIEFVIVTNPKNLGFGSACNQGIRLANTDFVAVLNNDTWLMPNWDEVLIHSISEKNLDVVGPFFDERPFQSDMVARAREFLDANPPRYRKHFVPILMFFTEDAIAKLKLDHGGIFDERFFVTYEDTDLFFRMKALGLKFAQTSRCYIWHESMGTRSQSDLLPEDYEKAGLKHFEEKWGFDPRKAEHTFLEKLKRRYRKTRAQKGLF
jgi:GT2 family glycosyltransferase